MIIRREKKVKAILMGITASAALFYTPFVFGDVLLNNYQDFYSGYRANTLQNGDYVNLNVDNVVAHYAKTDHVLAGFVPVGIDDHYIVKLNDGAYISVAVNSLDVVDAINNHQPLTVKGKLGSVVSTYDSYVEAINELRDADSNQTQRRVYNLSIDCTSSNMKVFMCSLAMIILWLWSLCNIISVFKAKSINN